MVTDRTKLRSSTPKRGLLVRVMARTDCTFETSRAPVGAVIPGWVTVAKLWPPAPSRGGPEYAVQVIFSAPAAQNRRSRAWLRNCSTRPQMSHVLLIDDDPAFIPEQVRHAFPPP